MSRARWAGALLSLALMAAGRDEPTFTIREAFGVDHPDQIITFDLTSPVDGASAVLRGADGKAVPCQVLEGGKKLAVRTGLPAGAVRTWTLGTGRPAAPADGLRVEENAKEGWTEVTNGLLGLRVPLPGSRGGGPPVLAVRTRSGAWLPAGGRRSAKAKSMEVRFLEKGTLVVKVEVTSILEPTKEFPGEPFHRCTIEVQAGQPSILFEEESSVPVSWSLRLDPLGPDQARYRGHHSSSKELGYEADGRQYRMWHERPPLDAFVDLKYDRPREYRAVPIWDPWVVDSGWYWQFYRQEAPPSADLAGLFAGRASRAVAPSASGVRLSTRPMGVEDFDSAMDGSGRLHVAYESDGETWYVPFAADLKAGRPRKVDSGLIHPSLAVEADGRILVAGYRPSAGGFALARGDGEAFEVAPVEFAPGQAPAIADPFPRIAAAGGTVFLTFHGEAGGQPRGGLLYAKAPGESAFSLRDRYADMPAYRRVNRPVLVALPDGRVRMAFSHGHYAALATIAAGARDFGGTAKGRTDFMAFGAAIDPRSGAAVGVHTNNTLWEAGPDGTTRQSKAEISNDHGSPGVPNRLTFAEGGGGEALFAAPGGEPALHRILRRQGGTWGAYEGAEALGIFMPRVHWHEKTGTFLIAGRQGGALALFAAKPGAARPEEVARVAETERRAADVTAVCAPSQGQPRARYQWGLFLGTKADLAPPERVQPIARQMNLRSGVNLDKIHRLALDFPDPPQGYGSPFMPKKAVQSMVARLREDKEGVHGKGYHGLLGRADPAARELLAAWADASGAPFRTVAKAIEGSSREFLGNLVSGDGIYSPPVHYWHGGLEASRRLVWIDQALGSSVLDPAERARVKAAAVLYGAVLWDNDFVPMDNSTGINLGTPNMPVQQSGYRSQYALFLCSHPMMKGRLAGAVDGTAQILAHDINEHGAHIGSVHYVGAGMGPTLGMMQQLQSAGVKDFFRGEPRAAKFAEAYLQWATPPEVRFGRERRMVAVGDGSTESSELFGMMGTGFAASNPPLSRRLMGMWRAQGKKHSSFHGTTLLKIDDDLPGDPPVLGSANVPGWFSVLRSGGGTPQETAVWFVNGNHYWDHSHSDQGTAVIYALGAPVSVDWGSMYEPRAAGAFFHSLSLPESAIGHPWDQDSPPLEAGGAWGTYAGTKTAQDEFRAEPGGGWARATMTAPGGKYSWTRAVSLAALRDDLPVIAVQDSWSGDAAAVAKVFTLNLMAEGEVETPGGRVTPSPRMWGHGERQGGKKELPSAGPVFDLPAGPVRLGFRGQSWKAHPAGGVDWDVFVVSPEPLKAHVGNWANAWSPEAHAFQEANGRPYEERQHILRLRGSGGFRVFVVPYLKGRKPGDLAVRADGGDVAVSSGGKTVRIGPDGRWRP